MPLERFNYGHRLLGVCAEGLFGGRRAFGEWPGAVVHFAFKVLSHVQRGDWDGRSGQLLEGGRQVLAFGGVIASS